MLVCMHDICVRTCLYLSDTNLIYLWTGCELGAVIVTLSISLLSVLVVLIQVVPQRHHRPAGRGGAEDSRHSWQLSGSTQQEKRGRFLPLCQVIMSANTRTESLFYCSNSAAEPKSYFPFLWNRAVSPSTWLFHFPNLKAERKRQKMI